MLELTWPTACTCLFKLRPGVLSKTLSHMWGKLNLPMSPSDLMKSTVVDEILSTTTTRVLFQRETTHLLQEIIEWEIYTKLYHYIFGKKMDLQTNPKPLIPIWKKLIVAASPWLQWILLWLAKYNEELTYLKGKDNVHYRHPQPCQPIGTWGSRQRWLWCNTSPPHHARSLSY